MNLHVLRPPVAELIFQVYAKPLHPELFDILATRTCQREDWHAALHITRSGHVIVWHNRDVFLSEVAEVPAPDIISTRRVLSYRFRGERNASVDLGHGIVYQTSFQVETLPPEIFLHVHDEILADGGKRGLLHHFQPSHRLNVAPVGLVNLETRAGCVFLSSFHTFPEENAVVKAQTLIEKTGC
jgi:uncharacterized protein DUF2617